MTVGREHVNGHGAPKVAYDTERAATEAIAALVERDPDAELDAYECRVCARFHIGNAAAQHVTGRRRR